jgi:hypothetical protein
MQTWNKGKPADRVAWGTGRMAFLAHLAAITNLIDAGCPTTAIYEQLKHSLAGLSYNQFSFHVRKHFGSTSKQVGRKRTMTRPSIDSAATKSVVTLARRTTNYDRPTSTEEPIKFIPGPRMPNPKDIY